MRTILLLAVLVSALPTHAATITFVKSRVVTGPTVPDSPALIAWELQNRSDPLAPPFRLEMSVTPAESGATFAFDESNASDYGLDWTAAVTASESNDWRRIEVSYGQYAASQNLIGTSLFPAMPYDTILTAFSLRRVEIEVVAYHHLGWPSVANEMRLQVRTIGEGETVPEPATWLLALACVAVMGRRRLA